MRCPRCNGRMMLEELETFCCINCGHRKENNSTEEIYIPETFKNMNAGNKPRRNRTVLPRETEYATVESLITKHD